MRFIFLVGALMVFNLMLTFAQIDKVFDLSSTVNKCLKDSLSTYLYHYENIKGEDQFYQFYNDILIFKEKLSKSIDDTLKISNDYLLKKQISIFFKEEIKILKVVENELEDPFYLQLNNELLVQKSKETIGENDNSFMVMMYSVYGEYGELTEYSLPFWIHKRSYVSISSRLGDNSSLNFYKKLKRRLAQIEFLETNYYCYLKNSKAI